MKNLILVFSLFSATFLFANKRTIILTGKDAAAKISNSEIIRMKNFTTVPNYVKFKKGKEIPLTKLEGWLNQFYSSEETFGLQLVKKEVGKLGLSHYRYKQTVNNIPVELSTLIAHVDDGMVLSVNGDLFSTINVSVNGSLSESTALNKALNFINAEAYMWEIPREEEHLKKEQDDDNATYYPTGEQVLINRGGVVHGEMKLAYKFNIYAQKPFSRREIYVDASSGEILWEETKIHHADAVGTATTVYSGVRTITTDNTGGTFRLRETGRGNGIETYDLNKNSTFGFGAAVDFTDNDNNWNNVNADLDQYATDAHWGAEMAYDYFLNEHGRNSIDGAGEVLRSYVHADVGGDQINASWDGQRVFYGDGSGGITPITTIDVVGHEITHGLTQRTADLVYQGESGALNESFSDIFGVSIDVFARPGIADFLIAEETGRAWRSMSDPNARNHPDTYSGNNWRSTAAGSFDNGGVHFNSSVQNYWFFLVSNGGSGINDNNDNYVVNPIGYKKAGSVAFRNLTVYLTNFSDYSDARFYAIQSAVDLFGQCSDEVKEVTNAWYAVGVGSEQPSNIFSNFDASGLTSCSAPFTVNFNNLSVNGANYTWNFGDGNTSTQDNPSHTYNSNGTYTVELVASSICGVDTETKTEYIFVNTPSPPSITNASVCKNDVANLGATGSGVLNWYSAPSGGSALTTGGSYLTPPLSATTTYYVEDVINASNQSMGKLDTSGGGANFNNLQYLIFDVYQQMELVSVVVYAAVSGNRTIELRNSAGAVLQSRTVNIPVGTQTVNLNFNIPLGTDYQLGVSNGSLISMYRNAQGVNYPYTLGRVGSIKRSSAGANNGLNHYYFFYDWRIKLEDCVSSRTAVTANVNPDPAIVANTSVNKICAGDPVTLSGSGGANYLWNNGVADGVSFNPTVTTTYTVQGTGVGGNNCENSDQVTIVVSKKPDIVANTTDDTICSGDLVTLSGSGGVNYLWDNGAADGISFTPTATATYTVTGTDTGGNNCEDSDQVTVVVNICTGIGEFGRAANINTHINGVNELVLDLTNFDKGSYSLVLLNSLGQVVESEQLNLTESIQREIVQLRTYAKGVYYVNLYNSTQNYTSKIVK